MPTKLILIRHGITEWNIKKRYSGFIDIALSEKGLLQSRLLAKRLKDATIHKVYSSDRKRAIQTAKIIFKKLKIEKIPGIREMHFGVFEGLTHKEILEKHANIYRKWLLDPSRCKIPEGEHLSSFKQRVVSAFKKIIALNKNKTTAVVCHGGAISIYLMHILKSKEFWKNIPHSASITVIEYKRNAPKIILQDDTRHLR
ncbi:MAG: histidine phosphatase family protein [Candidatus Omnitrophota bacterium]